MIRIRSAAPADSALLLTLIRELAEFEKLAHEVVATEETLRSTLFGTNAAAEVLIGEWKGKPVAFALFFSNYSTFLARPGLYLEDLYVQPTYRGRGLGKAMLRHLASLAVDRNCGRLEWSVLDWNESAIRFYQSVGAAPMSEWTTYRLTGEELNRFAREG